MVFNCACIRIVYSFFKILQSITNFIYKRHKIQTKHPKLYRVCLSSDGAEQCVQEHCYSVDASNWLTIYLFKRAKFRYKNADRRHVDNWPIESLSHILAYDSYASCDLLLINYIWMAYCFIKILLTNYRTRWYWYIFAYLCWIGSWIQKKLGRQTRYVKTPFGAAVDNLGINVNNMLQVNASSGNKSWLGV